jgi:hypothetical protein
MPSRDGEIVRADPVLEAELVDDAAQGAGVRVQELLDRPAPTDASRDRVILGGSTTSLTVSGV